MVEDLVADAVLSGEIVRFKQYRASYEEGLMIAEPVKV